jgi:hypothetical protein
MKGIQLATFLLPLIALPACIETAPASTNALSPDQRSELIERLQAAKKLDWRYAVDPNVAPVTEEDFLDQMNSADRVVKELTYGFEVPQQEIADALWVPPKSVTSGERDRLIRRLQEARRDDDHNEQEMLNDSAWTDSAAPVDTVTFDQQEELVDCVIKDLEIGEGVHWSTIKGALYVPPSR